MEAASADGPAKGDARQAQAVHFRGSRGVIIGDHAVQHNYVIGSGRIDGAAYLEQVRDIAPSGLHDRARELTDLAGFCHGDESYTWWQAGPWAGKSALMSWFALHPPAGLDVACFFVTGRLAAQADSSAFTEALLEQLASLANEQLPASLATSARDAHRRQLLREAAQRAHRDGRRLVLVIDGLDEDRSRRVSPVTGEGLPSIASLLPRRPVDGLRVIVSGRPDPEIPDDVPGDHPLRHCVIRQLAPSPYASDIERLAKEELRRLFKASEAERDVLGLVTAARGGLAGRDLEDLAGLAPHEVEELLSGTAGRTFTRRAGHWVPGPGEAVYLLGHEELQAAATAFLGEGRLAAFRNRLHEWAGAWRARNWPPGTPEYLLDGYFRLLGDLGDVARMTECALDLPRHERMGSVSGGDAAALAEVDLTLARIAAQDSPDSGAALALACHRDQLASRNADIPSGLPAVWAAIGQSSRAEALTLSIGSSRALVLAEIAEALSLTRQHERAAAAARQAGAATGRASILTRLPEVLAAAGLRDEAVALARQAYANFQSITDPVAKAEATASVVRALTAAGQAEQAAAAAREAEAIALPIAKPGAHAEIQAQIAGALARAGQYEQAAAAIRWIQRPDLRSHVLTELAGALARAGLRERAATTAREAQATAREIRYPADRARALARMAEEFTLAGLQGRAAAVARQAAATAELVPDPGKQAEALAQAARALAVAGLRGRAADVAGQAEMAAEFAADHPWSPQIPINLWQAQVVTQAAGALAIAGCPGQAADAARRAEKIARSADVSGPAAQTLAHVAVALVRLGQQERAEMIIRQARKAAQQWLDDDVQVQQLVWVVRTLAAGGVHRQAVAIAGQAVAVAQSVVGHWDRESALANAAEALALTAQHEQAEALLDSISDPEYQARALRNITRGRAAASPQKQAGELTVQAAAAAGDSASGQRQAATACAAGDWEDALPEVLALDPSACLPLAGVLPAWWADDKPGQA